MFAVDYAVRLSAFELTLKLNTAHSSAIYN